MRTTQRKEWVSSCSQGKGFQENNDDLYDLLQRAAAMDRNRAALAVGGSAVHSYGDLAHRSASLGSGLIENYGLAPGDRVALVMKNHPAFFEALFACWYAGLAAVPVNARLHPREFQYILENSGTRVCLATPELAEDISGISGALPGLEDIVDVTATGYAKLCSSTAGTKAEVRADDLAWLFYTSGTTGRPKGAVLSHRNLHTMILAYFASVDSILPQDCILHAAALSHGSGLYGLPHVAMGACQVIPESSAFDPAEIFALSQAYDGVTMFAAPTMVKRLVEAPESGGMEPFKTIVYGGGPMYVADLKRALDRFGNHFVQIYGQGESPMTITALSKHEHAEKQHPRYEERLASVGRAQMVVEVRVADEFGQDLPLGEAGEVLVRGDTVMPGYWKNPEATKKALRDGWLYTGDLGSLDADGYLTLRDRSKDLIISGGANIYPREIEEVLLRHPAVLECAVIGTPHAEWGEKVTAFVVLRDDVKADSKDLDRLCLAEIARFKRPRRYLFVESLPKNNYGKILKTELRQQVSARQEEST